MNNLIRKTVGVDLFNKSEENEIYECYKKFGTFLNSDVEEEYRLDLCRMPYNQVYGRYNSINIRSNDRYGKYPTYKNIDNNFSDYKEFINWFYNEQDSFRLPKEGGRIPPELEYHLDKDLLCNLLGLHEYSRKTCLFLPRYINALLELNIRQNKGDKRPIGLDKGRILKRTGKRVYTIYITIFGNAKRHILIDRSAESLTIGFLEYKICKEYIIRRISEEFFKKGLITPLAYYAILLFTIKDTSNTAENKYDRADYYIAHNKIFNKGTIARIEKEITTHCVPFIDNLASKIKTYPAKPIDEILGPYERSLLFRHTYKGIPINQNEYGVIFERRLKDMTDGDFRIPKMSDYDLSKMRK